MIDLVLRIQIKNLSSLGRRRSLRLAGTIVKSLAYAGGLVLFEVVAASLTAGASSAAKGSKFVDFIGYIKDNKLGNYISNTLNDLPIGKFKVKLKCVGGCFVTNTPVLMAYNPFKISNVKSLAFAAAMPIVTVPIQDVQLFDYAVAHKTVNSTYGLTASANEDDVYMGLTTKDPYTSDQQRNRDKYEINDTDWSSVSFEQVYGNSKCHFALHHEWIQMHGYEINKIVHLDLPEQGISGPFRITAIKHIIPQKKPSADDESSDYDYRPVTGLFSHFSDQVYTINFDNGEELGVTYQHPIYSVTAGHWRLAGELEVGEQVLSKDGQATVTSIIKKQGAEKVYNLEVKDLHNFLVGNVGVVVHNGCANEIEKYVTSVVGKSWKMRRPASGLKVGAKAGCSKCVKYADHNGKRVYFDDDDFPVFDEFAPKGNLNNQVIKYTSPDLQGYATDVPSGADINFADTWFSSVKAQYGNNITYQGNNFYVNGVKHTWHHHQDGVTMFLVPSDVHSIAHTGGGAMIKYGLKGAFQGPQF